MDYPIALDNDYGVWTAFANHFWPAVYVADAEGRIRYHHFGEGEYAMTEMVIQQLLMDAGADGIDQDLVSVDPRGLEVAADWQTLRSSETYVGYGQSVGFASSDIAAFDEPHAIRAPAPAGQPMGAVRDVDGCPSRRAVARRWRADCVPLPRARSESRDGPGGARRIGPVPCPARWHAAGRGRGVDANSDGSGILRDQRTYQLIRQSGPIADRLFEIEFLDAGAEAYCFTFG